MAGVARKIALSVGVLGLGVVIASSVRALHKSASREVHLSSSDSVLRAPGDDEPAALAYDGDELVYVTRVDTLPVTLRAVARRDLGGARVPRSRTIAALNFLGTIDYGGPPRPKILTSPARYLVSWRSTAAVPGRDHSETQMRLVDRRGGAETSLTTADRGQGEYTHRAAATPGGFVMATDVERGSEILILRDGAPKATHHTELEAAVRDAHEAVCADQNHTLPRRLGEVFDVAAVGDQVVVLASADRARECEPEGDGEQLDGRRLFAAPWAGGTVRALRTFEATGTVGTRIVGATKDAVWLRLVTQRGDAPAPAAAPTAEFVLVPLDGGPERARVPAGDDAWSKADTNAVFVVGEDLVFGRWGSGPAGTGELVRRTPDGSERRVEGFRGQPHAEGIRAWDAREVLLYEKSSLVRLAL